MKKKTSSSLKDSSHIDEDVQSLFKKLGREVSRDCASDQARNLLNFISIMLAIMDRDKQNKVSVKKKVQQEGGK
jgi:hypothetical protein